MHVFVNVNNIKKNIFTIRNYTKKDIMAVVKSDAYGLGADKIIPILISCNVKWFVFNKISEYLKCQQLVTSTNVLILESINQNFIDQYYRANIRVTINNEADLLLIKNNPHVIAHIQIDSGMNRVGIRNIDTFKNIIESLKSTQLEGIFTHFASELNDNDYYIKQKSKFEKYLEIYNFPFVHSASTPSLHKEICGNLVRVGMAMYGYHNHHLSLKCAITAYTRCINIINSKPGFSIGYQPSYQSKIKEQIGVLPIGYDDIIQTGVWYQNKQYEIIGKRCMGHTFIKIDEKINSQTWLTIIANNTIMNEKQYNFYHILTSLKVANKNYLKRGNYDIPKIYSKCKQTSTKCRSRTGSNQNSCFRIIRIKWCRISFKVK